MSRSGRMRVVTPVVVNAMVMTGMDLGRCGQQGQENRTGGGDHFGGVAIGFFLFILLFCIRTGRRRYVS